MKRKTIISALLLTLWITALLMTQGCRPTDELTEQEREYLRQKETIVFVSQARYPPFEFLATDGEHTGMCIELAHWMGAELGFKARFTDTSFEEAQEAVLSGQADVLTSFFYSQERDVKFDFTQMMFQVPASIFVDAEGVDIGGLDDLDGKRIAMQRGDYALEFLQDQDIAFEVIYTNDFGEATDAVLAGEADAIIGDEPIVLYHIHSLGLSHHIEIVGEPLYVGQNSMAVREGERLLASILNKGLDRARRAGVLERIERKWLGSRPPAPEFKYLPHLIIVVVGLLMILLFIWAWNLSLRERVRERTAELSESEERYRALYQDNPSMYFTVDEAGVVLSVNKFGAEHLGYTVEELVGQQVLNLFHQDDQKAAQRCLETCFQNPGQTERWELRKLRKDGSVLWVKETVYVVKRADGVPFGNGMAVALIVCDDITGRVQAEKALRESEARYRSLFSNTNAVMLLIDPTTGAIEDANQAACTYYGYDRDVLTAMTIADINILSPSQVYEEMQRVKQEERNHFFFRHRLASGKVRDVEVYSGPIQISGQQLLYSIIHDITARGQRMRCGSGQPAWNSSPT